MTDERRAGVLGHPISHSLSPLLHRAAYRALGLGWTYSAYDVTEETLKAFLDSLDQSWAGLSLTMPLKVAVTPFLDDREGIAKDLGVVNTVIVRRDGDGIKLVGANTDVYGVRQALAEAGVGGVRSAVILGSGATATSAMTAFVGMGCSSPIVTARSPEEAEGLLEAAPRVGASPVIITPAEAVRAMEETSVVISTVPVSVGADIGGKVARISRGSVLLDVVYDPLVTPLATAWTGLGGIAVNGSRMLLHQAAEQIRLMTGHPAPIVEMNTALVSHLSS